METTPDRSFIFVPPLFMFVLLGIMYSVISDHLRPIPSIWLFGVILVLLAPVSFIRWQGQAAVDRWLVYLLNGIVTLTLIWSVGLLVRRISIHSEEAGNLLRDASMLWLANIITFALWYWELDGGGPFRRKQAHYHSHDLIFPQKTLDDDEVKDWKPTLVDYTFLAFNNSTAFSPTDAPILSRRFKLLTMLQSVLSLTIIAMLAARAINTL